jgi:hypothetical protein
MRSARRHCWHALSMTMSKGNASGPAQFIDDDRYHLAFAAAEP